MFIVAIFGFEIKGLWMRTLNLVLIATVIVLGLGSSTLEAQLLPGPFLNVSPPVYQGDVQPLSLSTSVEVPVRYANSQWYPYVIARAEDRQWIRETPIELRPNRPLHFWGNSRRRLMR